MPADDGLEFVDTNVLLYAYDASAGQRHATARSLVGRLGSARRGVLSVQVLQEFYVNVTRKIAEPLAHDDAVARLRILARWPLHVPRGQDAISAAERAGQHQLSYWDAMIVHSASRMQCSVLWSEDLNHGQRFGTVVVRNPFAPAES